MEAILEKQTIQGFHENGQLAYTATIARLDESHSKLLYSNRLFSDDHKEWIRVGKQAKYYDNGQLAWELNYDDKGNVIKDDERSYRKDGSVIIF